MHVSTNNSGLSNRIKSLVSVIKLAEEKAQTAKEEARKRYESEEAYIMAEEQIKNAKTAQQKNVDAYKIAAEQETRVFEVVSSMICA